MRTVFLVECDGYVTHFRVNAGETLMLGDAFTILASWVETPRIRRRDTDCTHSA